MKRKAKSFTVRFKLGRGPHKHVAFWEPVFKVQVHFWHAPERSMLAEVALDGHTLDAHDGAGRSIAYRRKGRLNVHVWINPQYNLRDADVVANVAHECLHAATEVFAGIGAPLPNGNDEPFAYYVEMLVREFLRRMR